jgi:ribose 5-phosphate isomerase RpiB
MKLSKLIKQNLTDDQITYLMAGQRKANELSVMVEEALGVAKHIQVEAKRQVIIEGPPGVGKSYTTNQTCIGSKVQPIEIEG